MADGVSGVDESRNTRAQEAQRTQQAQQSQDAQQPSSSASTKRTNPTADAAAVQASGCCQNEAANAKWNGFKPVDAQNKAPKMPGSGQRLGVDAKSDATLMGAAKNAQRARDAAAKDPKVMAAAKDAARTAQWDPLESTCRHASLSIL